MISQIHANSPQAGTNVTPPLSSLTLSATDDESLQVTLNNIGQLKLITSDTASNLCIDRWCRSFQLFNDR